MKKPTASLYRSLFKGLGLFWLCALISTSFANPSVNAGYTGNTVSVNPGGTSSTGNSTTTGGTVSANNTAIHTAASSYWWWPWYYQPTKVFFHANGEVTVKNYLNKEVGHENIKFPLEISSLKALEPSSYVLLKRDGYSYAEYIFAFNGLYYVVPFIANYDISTKEGEKARKKDKSIKMTFSIDSKTGELTVYDANNREIDGVSNPGFPIYTGQINEHKTISSARIKGSCYIHLEIDGIDYKIELPKDYCYY